MPTLLPFAAPRTDDPSWVVECAIARPVGRLGFEVVTVELAGPKHRPVVRVFLDRQRATQSPPGEGGITLDDCATVTPIVSLALDAAENDPDDEGQLARVLGGGYTLEVSSPGVERPLAKRGHFERVVGRRVAVQTYEPLDSASNQRKFHGVVEGTDPDPDHAEDPRAGAVRVVEADGGRPLWIPIPIIKRAHLVYEAKA